MRNFSKRNKKIIIKVLVASLLLIGGSVIRQSTMNTPINQSICPGIGCHK